MKKFGVLIAIFFGLLVSNSIAMDIGAMQPTNTTYRVEIIHESYERDVRSTYPITHEHDTGIQDEQREILRFSYSPQPTWGLTLDAGATDAEYSEGYAPFIGLGGHLVVYQSGGFYTTIFAKGTYSFDIEYKDTYHFSGTGWSETDTEKQTEDLWEYGGGVQLGKEWTPCSGARIIGYGGAMVSFIDSSEDIRGNYVYRDEAGVETGTYSTHDFKIEEDHPVTFFVGIETTATKYEIGLRVESRFYDRTSFSVGLFKNF